MGIHKFLIISFLFLSYSSDLMAAAKGTDYREEAGKAVVPNFVGGRVSKLEAHFKAEAEAAAEARRQEEAAAEARRQALLATSPELTAASGNGSERYRPGAAERRAAEEKAERHVARKGAITAAQARRRALLLGTSPELTAASGSLTVSPARAGAAAAASGSPTVSPARAGTIYRSGERSAAAAAAVSDAEESESKEGSESSSYNLESLLERFYQFPHLPSTLYTELRKIAPAGIPRQVAIDQLNAYFLYRARKPFGIFLSKFVKDGDGNMILPGVLLDFISSFIAKELLIKSIDMLTPSLVKTMGFSNLSDVIKGGNFFANIIASKTGAKWVSEQGFLDSVSEIISKSSRPVWSRLIGFSSGQAAEVIGGNLAVALSVSAEGGPTVGSVIHDYASKMADSIRSLGYLDGLIEKTEKDVEAKSKKVSETLLLKEEQENIQRFAKSVGGIFSRFCEAILPPSVDDAEKRKRFKDSPSKVLKEEQARLTAEIERMRNEEERNWFPSAGLTGARANLEKINGILKNIEILEEIYKTVQEIRTYETEEGSKKTGVLKLAGQLYAKMKRMRSYLEFWKSYITPDIYTEYSKELYSLLETSRRQGFYESELRYYEAARELMLVKQQKEELKVKFSEIDSTVGKSSVQTIARNRLGKNYPVAMKDYEDARAAWKKEGFVEFASGLTSEAVTLMIGESPKIFVTKLRESFDEIVPVIYAEFLRNAPDIFSKESLESVTMSAGDRLLQAYAPFIVTKVAGEKYGEAVKKTIGAENPKSVQDIIREIPAFRQAEENIRQRTSASVKRLSPTVKTFMGRLDAAARIKSGSAVGSMTAVAVGVTATAVATGTAAAKAMGLSEALVSGTTIISVGGSVKAFGQSGLFLSFASLGWTVGGQLNIFPDSLKPYLPEAVHDYLDSATGAVTGMTAAGLMIAFLPASASAGVGIATLPVLTAGTAAILDEHGRVLWNGGTNLLMQGIGRFVGMKPKKLKVE